jgi:hypothetical protein
MNDPVSPVETTVSGDHAPAAAVGTQPGAPAAEGQDLTALRAQLDTLKAQIAEQQRTTEYWYREAKNRGEQPAAATAQVPQAGDDVDLLEVVTTQGAKGLDKVISDRGYVRKTDVEAMIETRAAQMTKEVELVGRFPDLKNQQSDFFKETARAYGEFKNQGVPQHLAMEMAAERVALVFMEAGKLKTRSQASEETAATREATRRARAAAQEGDRGNRAPGAGEADDGELSPEQQKIALSMLLGMPGADGKPMNREQALEAYRTRARKGVAMRGVR